MVFCVSMILSVWMNGLVSYMNKIELLDALDLSFYQHFASEWDEHRPLKNSESSTPYT